MKKLIPFSLFVCFSLCMLPAMAQQTETGEASYYNDKFHGRLTALGEKYDKTKMTCAHRSHHAGTMLRVTRLDNNKSVIVRVNDRGPFKPGRVVDLSRAAAEQIDLIQAGIAQVKLEVVQSPDVSSYNRKPIRLSSKPEEYNTKGGESLLVPKDLPSQYDRIIANEAVVKKSPETLTKKAVVPTIAETPTPATEEVLGMSRRGYAVQVASFEAYDDAQTHIENLKKMWFKNLFMVVKQDQDGISRYRVLMGPFDQRNSAATYRNNLKIKYEIDGFLVNLSK